ncbi:uncharacterized protein LOC119512899 isoform X2 [Choloepus didactylus]|uniref:uncharacterized protein LOC119512899 isoform X2 n=1 Tax=Choloepus didactylus TaxID=27675 RepID=UPI0018A00116|nr:uncharacterized protein LOC119512899 isoform X2 [Choloepus didactylus]
MQKPGPEKPGVEVHREAGELLPGPAVSESPLPAAGLPRGARQGPGPLPTSTGRVHSRLLFAWSLPRAWGCSLLLTWGS